MDDFDKLAEKSAQYEKVTKLKLVEGVPAVICLQLNNAKAFKNINIFDAFVFTATTILERQGTIIFAFIKESEIFFILNPNREFIFGGKVQVISSIISSLATTFFNMKINGKIKGVFGMFNAFTYNIPESEITSYLYVKQKEAERTKLNNLCFSMFQQEELQNIKSEERIRMLKEQRNIDFTLENYPDIFGALLVRHESKIEFQEKLEVFINNDIIKQLINLS